MPSSLGAASVSRNPGLSEIESPDFCPDATGVSDHVDPPVFPGVGLESIWELLCILDSPLLPPEFDFIVAALLAMPLISGRSVAPQPAIMQAPASIADQIPMLTLS